MNGPFRDGRLTVPQKLPLIKASSFAGRPVPPREWHVENLIPRRTVTLMSGDGSAGKTTIALQLAVATATGTTWLGKKPARGGVLFVTCEDDEDELHRKLADIARAEGLQLEEMGDLTVSALVGRNALLSLPDGETLHATELFSELRAEVIRLRPRLVVIDPLADVFGGDEIKKSHARQFIGMLRDLAIAGDTTVLLLSHPSQAGMSSGEGTSGNVAWSNSVRSRLYLEKPKPGHHEQPDPDARILSVRKANYGPAGQTIALRWQNGVYTFDGLGSRTVPIREPTEIDRLFLQLLREFDRTGRRVSHTPCATYAPKVFAEHPAGKGVKSAEFRSAMNRLFAERRIKVITEGPRSRQRSRLVEVGHAQD